MFHSPPSAGWGRSWDAGSVLVVWDMCVQEADSGRKYNDGVAEQEKEKKKKIGKARKHKAG